MQEPTNLPATDASRLDLRTISHGQLVAVLQELGQPAFRVKQIEQWLWEKGATSVDEMTNLPKNLREQLAERFSFSSLSQAAQPASGRDHIDHYYTGTAVLFPAGDREDVRRGHSGRIERSVQWVRIQPLF